MRRSITLQLDETLFTLWRLNDTEFRKELEPYSQDISARIDFHHAIELTRFCESHEFNFAKTLFVLELWFGESSDMHDPDKGSFSFPLLVHVKKSTGTFFYTANLYDSKGSFGIRLQRVMEKPVFDQLGSAPPIDSEWSQQILGRFALRLHELMKEAFDHYQGSPPTPFLKEVTASLLLYGYLDDEYFEQEFNSRTKYERTLKTLSSKLPKINHRAKVRSILEQITGNSIG